MNIQFISAGAGSGKTHRLTEILFGAMQRRQVIPSGVLATTFTRKAAAELRERVRSKLLKENAWLLACQMDAARIGTVNSVCGELLTRFAFEAGISPELQVLDELQAAQWLDRVMDEELDDGIRSQLNELAERLGQTENYAPKWPVQVLEIVNAARSNSLNPDALPAMAAQSTRELLSFFPKPVQKDWNAELAGILDTALPAIQQAVARFTAPIKKSEAYAEWLQGISTTLQSGHLPWSCWLELAKEEGGAKLRDLSQPIRDLARQHMAHPGLHADIGSYAELLFSAAKQVMQAFAEEKARYGLMDFTDQESLLLQLLDNPDVQAVLREELQLLLVDEFQDTSPIQLAIFLKLASLARQTWWVGDIKQAIYGFRGSDPALMETILASMAVMGQKPEILEKSWRSRPALVEFVNKLFTPAFAPLPAEQIRLVPARPELLPDATAFAYWDLDGSNKDKQYAALARAVKEFAGSGYQVVDKDSGQPRAAHLRDIALLAYSNDDVLQIASALGRAGVPVLAGLPGLLATPEAVLALAGLRRIYDKSDTVASAEILALARGQEPEVWLENRLQWLKQNDHPSSLGDWLETGPGADPTLERLTQHRDALQYLSPVETLRLAIHSIDLPRVVLRWQSDAQSASRRLANVDALLELAKSYEDECRVIQRQASVSGLLLWLKQLQRDGKDQCALPDIDAVRILTHHAAKGLEWPVVIALQLNKDIRSRLWGLTVKAASHFDLQQPLAGRSLRFWAWPWGDKKKLDVLVDANALEQCQPALDAKEAACKESLRLLYVSLTRARDLLVFALPVKDKGIGEWLGCLGEQNYKLTDVNAWHLDEQASIPYRYQFCPEVVEITDSQPAAEGSTAPLHWFPQYVASVREPLLINPSSAEPVSATVGEIRVIAKPLALKTKANRTELGNALHACFAAAQNWTSLTAIQVQAILQAHGVADAFDSGDVCRYLDEWRQALRQTLRPSAMDVEVPVRSQLPNGQVMEGQLDVLLQTESAWVVIDHKTVIGGAERATELVSAYSGQLAAYRDALERISPDKPVQCWLHLPLDGVLVGMEFTH